MVKVTIAPYLSVLLLALPTFALADVAPAVSPTDQVQFQQKTVEAGMQELQDRMFHLADLTRDTEPDDSSRLLMAVCKAGGSDSRRYARCH